jgi:nicotinate-nucleotide pyrophosphorylase (carboxylating)
MDKIWMEAFIQNALKEDIGDGDHTSLACIPEGLSQKAQLLCKENGVIAGIEVAQLIFHQLDEGLTFTQYLKDGAQVKKGDLAFIVEGNARSILTAERLVLNCMQRMSGIATTTARIVKNTSDYAVKILDTRKTTPGLRALEKWAVKIGGGANHRFGLYDMLMIKDNHVDYAGGITQAIHAANHYLSKHKKQLPIEIEVRSMNELEEVLKVGQVQRIMLDNFTPAAIKLAIERIDGAYETEASGGITEDNILAYAKSGVQFISVGALTHHIKSLDMSLKAC